MPAFLSQFPLKFLIPGLYLLAGMFWLSRLEPIVTSWATILLPSTQHWSDWLYLLASTGFLAVLLDQQERYYRPSTPELALRRNEERYRQAVENSPNPIFSVNRQGDIQTWNRACEEVYQYGQEILGQPYSKLLAATGGNQTIAASVAAVFAGNSLSGVEVVYRCRDASQRYTVSRLYPLFNSQGDVESCVFANTDITVRYQAEANLQQLNQELEARVEQRTAELRASLEEKELLLKEVHHRVKNNLQVISSLFSLQAQSIQDARTLAILTDSQNRINTMALIHEKLYQSNFLSQIDFQDYIRNLTTDLVSAANLSTQHIQLELDVDAIPLDLDTAMRCGLIINELVSNALKHGFPGGQSGKISLSFKMTSEDQLMLTVADTGIGLPPDLDARVTHSLGLRLVRILSRKLQGTLACSNHMGTSFQISFPK